MGKPRRTPSKVMMTMNISTAANTPPRCPTTPTSIHTASPTLKELTASQAGTRCTDNPSSTILTVLREIPTRISQQNPTATVVDLPDADDDRYSNTCTHLSIKLFEIPTLSRTPTTLDYRAQLAAITADCERLQQRWQLPAAIVVDPSNDRDEQSPNTCSPFSDTVSEIPNISSPPTPFDYRTQLAAITAECERMQQRWPLLAAAVVALPDDDDARHLNTCPHLSIDLVETPNRTRPPTNFRDNDDPIDYSSQIANQSCCAVAPADSSPSISNFPCADLYHRPTNTTLTTECSLCNPAAGNITTDLTSILAQSTSLLVEQKRQSTTLRQLAAQSEELRELMSLLLCKLFIPDPCPSSHCYAPNPLPHPTMVPVNQKPATVAVTATQPNLLSTPQSDKLLPRTMVPPWPPPPLARLLQPTQPSKPLPCKTLIRTKTSVDHRRSAMSWSKDCLHLP